MGNIDLSAVQPIAHEPHDAAQVRRLLHAEAFGKIVVSTHRQGAGQARPYERDFGGRAGRVADAQRPRLARSLRHRSISGAGMTASPTPFSQSAAVIRTHPRTVGAAPAVMNTAAGAHLHPGLVSLPGSQSCFDTLAVALRGAVHLCGRAPSGRVILPRRARTFIEPQPRDQIADDCADRSPVVMPSHAAEHDAPVVQAVAKSVQETARDAIWALAPRDWIG